MAQISTRHSTPHSTCDSDYTPRLELDLNRVRRNYRKLKAALDPQVEIYYSVKTNPTPEVIETLIEKGARLEIVSEADLDAVHEAIGLDPWPGRFNFESGYQADAAFSSWEFQANEAFDKAYPSKEIKTRNPILSSNPVPTPSLIRRLTMGSGRAIGNVMWNAIVTCQSKRSIDTIAQNGFLDLGNIRLMFRLEMPLTNAMARINLDKFGCSPDTLENLISYAKFRRLQPYGISFHVGGQQTDPSAWKTAIETSLPLIKQYNLKCLDIGGGFPVRFRGNEPSIEKIAAVINPLIGPHLPELRVIAEPGRYLVADAGTIVCTVLDVHERGDKRWVYIDSSIFGPLSLYNNHPYPISVDGKEKAKTAPAILTTNTCDGRDIVDSAVLLPKDISPGDTLRFHKAGAYTVPFKDLEYAGGNRMEVEIVGQNNK